MVTLRDPIVVLNHIILLLLHSVFGESVERAGYHYYEIGSNVTLQTGNRGNNLKSVEWKHDDDLAVQWIRDQSLYHAYRDFNGSTFLNYANGDLTLIGVTESESGEYTLSLNDHDTTTKFLIKVIHRVPVPMLTVICSSEGELMRFCLYTCAGNTSQSEPVSYGWSRPDSAPLLASNKTINVTMSLTGLPDQFICTMDNPVSKETSKAPPTTKAPPPTKPLPCAPGEQHGYLVPTLILPVILSVLLAVIIGVHRHMAGVWIWTKEIWEKRKDEKKGRTILIGSPEAEMEGISLTTLDPEKDSGCDVNTT